MEHFSVERRSLTSRRTVRATSRGSLVPRSGVDVRLGEVRLFTSNALYVTTSPSSTSPSSTPLSSSPASTPLSSSPASSSSSPAYLDPSADVLSLHPPGVPRSPWSLHTEAWDAYTDGGFEPGDRAVLVNGTLVVTSASGNVVVCDFADAPVWTSSTEMVPIATDTAKAALAGLLTLNHVAIHDAWDRLVGRDEALVSALCNLSVGFGHDGAASSDPKYAEAERALLVEVERLTGFGPGLTPAGDDLLAACLVSLLRWDDSMRFGRSLASAVATRLAIPNATGFVSRQLLQLARLGFTHEAVDDLLLAVPLGMAATQQAAERLLQVGQTSGSDSLLGVVSALRVYCSVADRMSR